MTYALSVPCVTGTCFGGFAALVARIPLGGGILAPVPGPPASFLPWPRGGPAWFSVRPSQTS